MQHDLIVIGGSYAGMAAALQLLRARKSVLVIDAGERRNRFASHSHGFLGQDGADPAAIAAQARRQLDAYPTLSWHEGRAERVSGQADDFTVTTSGGQAHRGRRILLAIGVADQLPSISGLAERWGNSIFHCPYCHGYELDQGRIGVIATGPMSLHQAEFLTEWGKVTLLLNHAVSLGPDERAGLERRGVAIEDVAIDRIEEHADVRLADGRLLRFAGLFTAARSVPLDLAGRGGRMRARGHAAGPAGAHRRREQDLGARDIRMRRCRPRSPFGIAGGGERRHGRHPGPPLLVLAGAGR